MRKLPYPILRLRSSHDSDSAAETSIIHRSTQTPLVLFGVVEFDSFQISGSVETAHCVELAVDHCQTNLKIGINICNIYNS